jgi:hypothetical protein
LLTILAGVFILAGLIVGFVSLISTSSGGDAGNGFWIAASLIGAAFCVYVAAQIVHIRALLAKK